MLYKYMKTEDKVLFIGGSLIAIITLVSMFYFYKDCNGKVVRGVWGLECIK